MEVMSTPMGRMIQPMLENMQRNLTQYSQQHHLFNDQVRFLRCRLCALF